MKIDDYITYFGREEDRVYLKTRLLPVSMRLFRSSEGYRNLILACCSYIRRLALEKCEDYPQPFGMSGANTAIPFNIIGIVSNRGEPNASCRILINPVFIPCSGERYPTQSNCGSLRLQKRIWVMRDKDCWVDYFDEDGIRQREFFNRVNGAATVQHEIDHNLGILITDREVH